MGYSGQFRKQKKSGMNRGTVIILSIVAAVMVLLVAVLLGFTVYRVTMEKFAAQRPEPVVTEWVRPTLPTEPAPETEPDTAEAAQAEPAETQAPAQKPAETTQAAAPVETTEAVEETQPEEETEPETEKDSEDEAVTESTTAP